MNTPLLLKLIDRFSFFNIFIGWIIMILSFGVIYALGSNIFFAQPPTFFEAIYFSFTISPTRGFENLTPIGIGRLLTLIESVLTLFTYSVVISKLVSYKQATILQEIYTISFQERINRLRSVLYLFRADLNRVIEHFNDKKNQPTLRESTIYIHNFAVTMHDIDKLLHRNDADTHYIKGIDFTTFELILNSIIISMDKLSEFLNLLKDSTTALPPAFITPLDKIYFVNEKILHHYTEIDDVKIKNKLKILETLNDNIKKASTKETANL